MTPPIVGYDTTRPAAEGLYRIASLLYARQAAEAGVRLNGSAGAADFKRQRGARGVIEYSAMDVRGLALHRRLIVGFLAWALERFAVPMMRERGL